MGMKLLSRPFSSVFRSFPPSSGFSSVINSLASFTTDESLCGERVILHIHLITSIRTYAHLVIVISIGSSQTAPFRICDRNWGQIDYLRDGNEQSVLRTNS